MNLLQLATTSNLDGTNEGMFLAFMWVFVALVVIAGVWKTFKKAKRPGWAAIIPLYNTYTMIKVAGRPGWWLLLYFVPIVNIVVHLVVSLDIAKAFKKSEVFGVAFLWLIAPIGYLILGFGDAKYAAPKH